MPIYEFKCKKCNKDFEKIIAWDAEGVECPECRSQETEKQLSSFAVRNPGGKSSGIVTSNCGPSGST